MVSIVVVVMATGLAVVHGSARAKLDRSGVATEINAMMFDTFLAALILAGLVNGVVIGAIVLLGCGFRSRSAFYEAFRRERGVNPGEFHKQAGARLS
jgi:hypothetical protein